MTMARSVAMTLSCLGAVVAGIAAGPYLQGKVFWLADGVLPHPDGCGYRTIVLGGVSGACLLYVVGLVGAFWMQFLTVPLALSFFLPPNFAARVCLVSALLIGVPAFITLAGILFGLFGSLHGMLLFFGFPALCIGALSLRAAHLNTSIRIDS